MVGCVRKFRQISHKTLVGLQYAKDNGVIIFCFSAHNVYNHWILNFWHLSRLSMDKKFNRGWDRILAESKHAFAKTEIYPFETDIFEDWMIKPSSSTDKPLIEEVQNDDQGQSAPQQRLVTWNPHNKTLP